MKLSLICLLPFTVACSTITVNKAELAQVKSAALIGFGADLSNLKPKEDAQRGGVMGAINAVNAIRKMSDGRMEEERRAQADQSFRAVADRLSQELSWKVLAASETSSTADYATEYQNRSAKHWGARTTEAVGSTLYVKGILWDADARRLERADRDRLMDALKVDALAIATLRLYVGKQTGFGKITRYPQATVELLVYHKGGEDPIWKDRATGDVASAGFTETMGFASTGDATPIVLEAVKLSLDTLIARYKAEN